MTTVIKVNVDDVEMANAYEDYKNCEGEFYALEIMTGSTQLILTTHDEALYEKLQGCFYAPEGFKMITNLSLIENKIAVDDRHGK